MGNSVIDDSNNKISIDLEKNSNQVAPFCTESEILMPSDENEESFPTLVPSRYVIADLRLILRYTYRVDAVGSSGILKLKQKLRITFNFDKQDVVDLMKFSKMTMCRASEAT